MCCSLNLVILFLVSCLLGFGVFHLLVMLLFAQIWQCGGMMVDAPCSRVGHIYRKFAPFPNPGVGDFVGRVSHLTSWLKVN